MPFRETDAVDQRLRFVADWLSGAYSKRVLCAAYGVSRPTGDKWLARYAAEGPAGIEDRSRAPHGQPNATSAAIRERIIAAKLAHQHWGPKKVMDYLRRTEPATVWPADSTAGAILKAAGLVQPRRRRRRAAPREGPLAHCEAANAVWSADFKGDYVLADGRRCYPLTLTDNHSRYLLGCHALAATSHAQVAPWFEWAFREYGLPAAIRTDNGTPFASLAAGGLSRLSAWWVRLGVVPERIEAGRPDQNGRHERMHRTLKAEATRAPVPGDLAAQQQRFDAFTAEYNTERAHEGLGRRPPAEHYAPSPRPYPEYLAPVAYDSDRTVRRVRSNGEIKWGGERLYLTEVLAGEPVGLKAIDTGLWELRYSFHLLGYLDERELVIRPRPTKHRAGKRKPCARSKT